MILEDYFIDPSKWSALQFFMGNFEDAQFVKIGENTSKISYVSSNELQRLAWLAIDLEQVKTEAIRIEEKSVTFYQLGTAQTYNEFYHNQYRLSDGEWKPVSPINQTKAIIEVEDNAYHVFLTARDQNLIYTFQDVLGRNKTFSFYKGTSLPYQPDMIIGKNLFIQDLNVDIEFSKQEEKINSALLDRRVAEQQKKALNESSLLHLKWHLLRFQFLIEKN